MFIVEMNPLVYKNVFDLLAKLSENTMGCFNTESKIKDNNFLIVLKIRHGITQINYIQIQE